MYLDAQKAMQYAKDLSGPALPPSHDQVVAMTLRGLMKANEQMKAQAPPPTAGKPPTKNEAPPFDPTHGGRIPGNSVPAVPAVPAQPKPGQPKPGQPKPPPAQPGYRPSPLRDSSWPRNPYTGKDVRMYNLWEEQMAAKRGKGQPGRKGMEGATHAMPDGSVMQGAEHPQQGGGQAPQAPALQQAAMQAQQAGAAGPGLASPPNMDSVAALVSALAQMRSAHPPQPAPTPSGPMAGDVLGLRRARLSGLSEKLGPLRR